MKAHQNWHFFPSFSFGEPVFCYVTNVACSTIELIGQCVNEPGERLLPRTCHDQCMKVQFSLLPLITLWNMVTYL